MSELLPSSQYEATHALGHEAFWLDQYRLLSHFLASKSIAALEGPRGSRSLKLYEKAEISRLLINIATYYRVKYDDGSWEHAPWLHDEEYKGVGSLINDLKHPENACQLDFREACNKIIHAKQVHFDGDVDPKTKSECLNPIVYLYGDRSQQSWKATVDIITFCKAAANVIV